MEEENFANQRFTIEQLQSVTYNTNSLDRGTYASDTDTLSDVDHAFESFFESIERALKDSSTCKVRAEKALNQFLSEMRRGNINIASYLFKSPKTSTHRTLLHTLIELSVRNEPSIPELLGSILIVFASLFFFRDIGGEHAIPIWLLSSGLIILVLALSYTVPNQSLIAANMMVSRVYRLIKDSNRQIDPDTEAYIKELCNQYPRLTVIIKHFQDYC